MVSVLLGAGILYWESVEDLRCGDVLPLIDREEQIVSEVIYAMATMSSPLVVKLCGLGQPHVHVSCSEVHWPIVDSCVVCNQVDARQRGDEIGLDADNLIAVCGNPGSALQCHRKTDPIAENVLARPNRHSNGSALHKSSRSFPGYPDGRSAA